MATAQKKIFAKVLDFVIEDVSTKQVIARVNYATNVTISQNYEELKVRGGMDNQVQANLYHSPESQFSADLVLIDNNVMGAKTGAKITTGSVKSAYFKVFKVDSSAGTVSLPSGFVPMAGTLKIYNTNDAEDLLSAITVGTPASDPTQYSVSGQDITFNDALKGKTVIIAFDYMTGATAQELKTIVGRLPGLISIKGYTIAEDKAGNTIIETLIVPRVKPNPSYEFALSSGQVNNIPLSGECYSFVDDVGDEMYYKLVTDPDLSYN